MLFAPQGRSQLVTLGLVAALGNLASSAPLREPRSSCQCEESCTTRDHHTEWCYVSSTASCPDRSYGIISGRHWSEHACQGANTPNPTVDRAAPGPAGDFKIVLDFETQPAPAQRAAFDAAVAAWEVLIPRALDQRHPGAVRITTNLGPMDGPGGKLGSAGPSNVRYGAAITAHMEFDTADIDRMEQEGTLRYVIMHEMGHALGLGTLWNHFMLLDAQETLYHGRNGVEAFKRELNRATPYILVETDGGKGTAGGHWDNTHAGPGAGSRGRDDDHELMTGSVKPNTDVYMAAFTAMSVRDIGFETAACIDDSDCATGVKCNTFPGCADSATCWLPNICGEPRRPTPESPPPSKPTDPTTPTEPETEQPELEMPKTPEVEQFEFDMPSVTTKDAPKDVTLYAAIGGGAVAVIILLAVLRRWCRRLCQSAPAPAPAPTPAPAPAPSAPSNLSSSPRQSLIAATAA